MAKKPAKSSPGKTAKPVSAAKAKTPAKPAPAKAAAPVASEKPAAADAPVKAKLPPVPPRPVPPHQQFLSKSPKLQHMTKGRIFRHQGR